MRVLHIGLLSHYTDGMAYQDNFLPEMNIKSGHEVMFISDTYKYVNGILTECEEEDITYPNGMRLVRLSYDFIVNKFITNKIQKIKKLINYLNDFQPDTIMYHGLCGYELMTVAEYKKRHPQILFYVDSHEDFNNTARTFLARIAYKYIHGYFIKKARAQINKILYLSLETKFFLKKMYKILDKDLEFYPLGGVIQSKDKQDECRRQIIEKYSLRNDVIICSHSGKLDQLKRTKELLTAFSSVKTDKLFLIVFGSIPSDQKDILEPLIAKDNRIVFEGWKDIKESTEILCGVDVYCQPGSQSATSQVALCCGCAEMVFPHKSYVDFYKDNVIYVNSEKEMKAVFQDMVVDTSMISSYKERAYNFASQFLSYELLSERYLS